jgi:hypothetical protein
MVHPIKNNIIYSSKRKEFEIIFMLIYYTILGHRRSRIAIRTGSVRVTGAGAVGSIPPRTRWKIGRAT